MGQNQTIFPESSSLLILLILFGAIAVITLIAIVGGGGEGGAGHQGGMTAYGPEDFPELDWNVAPRSRSDATQERLMARFFRCRPRRSKRRTSSPVPSATRTWMLTVDIGRPDRAWHLLPFVGHLNVPNSLLAWDVLVLNGYLALNLAIVTYLLYTAFFKRPFNTSLVGPLVLLTIPFAIAIHTVTAFIYAGLAARPFWNVSILAPRFLASAFCSGPAVMLILFQILSRTTRIKIRDEAIWKIAELMAYAMFLNLFLFGAEIFREYYSNTHHFLHTQYLYRGIHGHVALVPYAWASVICSVIAFILFLVPATRKNIITLNIGCLLIYTGVYIEKGMALVIPGMTPDTLGEIYEYIPTVTEIRIGAAVFSIGFLVFTVLCKIAVPILQEPDTRPDQTLGSADSVNRPPSG